MLLEFTINNQKLERTDNTEHIVNLSNDYLELNFQFESEDWVDTTRYALFRVHDKRYKIGIINDTLTVPSQVLAGDTLQFSVYGIREDGYRVTTNNVWIHLLGSGYGRVEDVIPDEDLDVVDELYLAINEHTHTLDKISDVGTVELMVTYEDDTCETFDVVVKH